MTEPAGDPSASQNDSNTVRSIASRTLGGKQFWADCQLFRGCRIQRNVLSGHYRLLDEKDSRQTSGTFSHCQTALKQLRSERDLKPMRGTVVLVLHGLFRTRNSMQRMCDSLEKDGELLVLNMGYPSTRGSVGQHAKDLARVIDGLEGIEKIHFVAHSLGNLVIRHYLADRKVSGEKTDPRFGRMVMLGAPNHGAELAERLIPLDLSKQITGAAAWQIARGWDELEPELATPSFPFAIVAGGNGKENGRNPLIDGDDDLVVSVASTRLVGASDFRLLPVWHTTMMNNQLVQQMTLRFLRDGYLESAETRQGIRSAND